jgi:hypothetical protein
MAVIDREFGLVPGTDQMSVANRAVSQWRAGMRTKRLESADFIAVQNQQRLGFAKLHLKTTVSLEIGQVSDSMQWHVHFLLGFWLGVGRDARGSGNHLQSGRALQRLMGRRPPATPAFVAIIAWR